MTRDAIKPLMSLLDTLLSCDVYCRPMLARLGIGWHQSWLVAVECQLELWSLRDRAMEYDNESRVVVSNADLSFMSVCCSTVYVCVKQTGLDILH
jgi:hypothetical protein